jgi:5'-nucleotidase
MGVRGHAAARARRHFALCCALFAGALAAPHARADDAAELLVLGLNDFHGQLTSVFTSDGRSLGGAAVLAAHLRGRVADAHGHALIVHAGDWVGASPPASGLLADEPAIAVLNALGNAACARAPMSSHCNVVGTLGNHEFDDGLPELLRLLRGGPSRARVGEHWPGARVSYVSSNVVHRRGARILPAYAIKHVAGVRLGVIGAVLADTPSMVVASGVRDVRFLDEAASINAQVRALRAAGVQAIIVAIHQGGTQPAYEGPTRTDAPAVSGPIVPLVHALDPAVDVVVSGHAHAFTNALVDVGAGRTILVTQASSTGRAYAAITLRVDRQSGEVLTKSARIVPTDASVTPAPDVAELVARAAQIVAPIANRVVGRSPSPLSSTPNEAGESSLGNLIADAQRTVSGAEVALMNLAGIRAQLPAGELTWGALFAAQPFGNVLVTMELTGAELRRTLEQQWEDPALVHRLAVSGLRYTFDPGRPVGARVGAVEVAGRPLADTDVLRVTANNFLAEGGSGFSVLRAGRKRVVGGVDVDALVAYIAAHGAEARLDGRVRRE